MTAVWDYSPLVRAGLVNSRMNVFEPLDSDMNDTLTRSTNSLSMLSRFSLPPLPPHASRLTHPYNQATSSRPSSIVITPPPPSYSTTANSSPVPPKINRRPQLHLQTYWSAKPQRPTHKPHLSLDTNTRASVPVRSSDSFLSFSTTGPGHGRSSSLTAATGYTPLSAVPSCAPPISHFSPATPDDFLDASLASGPSDWIPSVVSSAGGPGLLTSYFDDSVVPFDFDGPITDADDFDMDVEDMMPCSALSPGLPSPAPRAPPPTPLAVLPVAKSPLVRAPTNTPVTAALNKTMLDGSSPIVEQPGTVQWTQQRRSAPQATLPHSPISAWSAVASPPTGARYSDVFYLWDSADKRGSYAGTGAEERHPYGMQVAWDWGSTIQSQRRDRENERGSGHSFANVL